ncbi:MAG: chalcone isomerase family protein [Bdellovibrionota bacterium]
MKTLLFVLTLLASLARANPNFTQEMKVDDQGQAKKLILSGVGTRKATIFKVKVYDAALYVEDKAKIDVNDASLKVARMEFLRDVSTDDVKKAWEEGLAKTCGNPCALDFKEFLANVREAKKGQFNQYTLRSDRVTVDQGGTTNEYAQKGLASAILKTWIGDSPPNPELKEGMLGRSK